MSLSFGSLASTAVATFKGLAVAAAGADESPAGAPVAAAAPVATPIAPAVAETPEPKPANRRLGSVLDAYA